MFERRYPRVEILPEPPDNPDFLELSDDQQDNIAGRFERGIRLTRSRNDTAYSRGRFAWAAWVKRCSANREAEKTVLERIRRKQR